jgi:hypothetical protein
MLGRTCQAAFYRIDGSGSLLAMSNDPILLKALEKIEAATAEVRSLENFIAKYRELQSGVSAPPACDEGPVAKPATVAAANCKPWPTDKILLEVGAVLKAQGPMQLKSLHQALTARGVIIGGKEPRNNLCAKLSANGSGFESSKSHGWWFEGLPLPSEVARYQLPPYSENEKGPEALGLEPSHMNGVNGSYPFDA